tara:strand:- start:973 stop:1671 length:699 start_codon:yes stop_codon:yes gene_type:complete
MSAVKNLKWKRSLSTLRFSYEELEYIEEVSAEAALEFEKYYRSFCALNNIDIPALEEENKHRVEQYIVQEQIPEKNDEEPQIIEAGDNSLTIYQNTQEDSEDYQMTADEIAIHEAFSKLFKKLALKLHPDRINKFLPEDEKEIRAKEFKEANEAFDNKKYFFLLDIADKYRVSTPRNYDQQNRWMKRETEKIQGVISQKKNSYSYGFAEAETEEEKELLIRKFIFQLFRINV